MTPLGTNNLPLQNSLGNGNAARNDQRTASYWNTDMSLMKRFPIGPTRLAVRIDVFNVFNQDEYGLPNINMSSPSFGRNTQNWGRRSAQLSAKVSW